MDGLRHKYPNAQEYVLYTSYKKAVAVIVAGSLLINAIFGIFWKRVSNRA